MADFLVSIWDSILLAVRILVPASFLGLVLSFLSYIFYKFRKNQEGTNRAKQFLKITFVVLTVSILVPLTLDFVISFFAIP